MFKHFFAPSSGGIGGFSTEVIHPMAVRFAAAVESHWLLRSELQAVQKTTCSIQEYLQKHRRAPEACVDGVADYVAQLRDAPRRASPVKRLNSAGVIPDLSPSWDPQPELIDDVFDRAQTL